MKLPAPKLDDRTFDDLMAEAKRRIVTGCPGWTDFNPSDPGIALVELMAWMVDTTLYRLNRVPELNYIKLLELIGVRLQPARPARTWVFFEVGKDIDDDQLSVVLAGTRLATRPERGGTPIRFSTTQNLSLTSARVKAIATRFPAAVSGAIREQLHTVEDKSLVPFRLFDAGTSARHLLYLSDPALQQFGARDVRVVMDLDRPASRPLYLEWEAWNGSDWRPLVPAHDTTMGLTRSGGVIFREVPSLKPSALGKLPPPMAASAPPAGQKDEDAAWIRARYVGPDATMPILRALRYQTALPECSLSPRRAFVGSAPVPPDQRDRVAAGPALAPLEFNQEFEPMGQRVAAGAAFYIDSELFQKAGATIRIELSLRHPLPLPQEADEELEIHWEYRAPGLTWQELGVVNSQQVLRSHYDLRDNTYAFTRNKGCVEFTCPADLERGQLQVNAEPGWFVRARIEKVHYRSSESMHLVADRVALGFSEIPRDPASRGIEGRTWRFCFSEDYREARWHSVHTPFAPFQVDSTRDPALYVGLSKAPSARRGNYQMFVDIEPPTEMSLEESIWDRDTAASGPSSLVAADLKDARSLAWKILHATDEVSKHLRGQLSDEAKEVLQSKTATVEQLGSTLAPALNEILDRAALYDPVRFRDISLAANTRWLLSQAPIGEERSRLNRLLLADAYPKEVEPASGWNWRPALPASRLIPPGIVWEYLSGPDTWRPLATKDGTDSLRRSGMIGFDSPGRDWAQGRLFNTEARWLRARWAGGDVESAPRLRKVILNGVEVEQFVRDERTLGTSNGDKHQTFSLHTEILDYPEVWVACAEAPAQKDVPVKTANDSQWERWTEVRNNFRRSEITDALTPVRHFTAELGTGTIRFGDGVRGSIPPNGQRISVVYRVTAGAAGNVGPNTITVLDDSIAGVQVTNIYAASGGADRESIDAARQRGPWDIKHRDRAVTAEDFVQLALRTSTVVGKAGCFVLDGVVHVVVVPRDSQDLPQPSRWLIEDVDKQLRERKLINTLLRVEGPTYEAIDLEIDIVLEPSWRPRFAEARAEIEKRLRRFIHPIDGMLDKKGWEMGRTLHLSELYYCLEQVEHVDHVRTVRFRRSGSQSWSDTKISVGERSFPCFSGHLEIRHTLE